MRFRPCIDLHLGKVKQIVGATLSDADDRAAVTHFVSNRPPSYYADLYHRDGLEGGHVIMLGPGNEAAAEDALAVHPGTLQVGGGMTPANAREWLRRGAAKIIVTSYLFQDGRFHRERLREMADCVGASALVVDLSCRRREEAYVVACNRWQTLTELTLSAEVLEELTQHCSEFLVHAVDVEGLCGGVDAALIEGLAAWSPVAVTYAGGIRSLEDVETVSRLGRGRVDFTVGSALDIFGGKGVAYRDLVERDRRERSCGQG